jgi:hypothetical protein
MEGMLLIDGVGLFIAGGGFWSGGCAKLVVLEADMLRAGEAGRAGCENGEGDGAGGGAIVLLLLWFEDWRAIIAGSAGTVVGVACGVDVAELALATEMGAGVWRGAFGGG